MKFILSIQLMVLACMTFGQQSFPYFHGPTALATGNIFTIHSGIQTVYGNPAKTTSIRGWAANISAQNQFEIPELTCFQLSAAYGSADVGSFALSLQQIGPDKYRDQKFHILYARKLGKDLSIGTGFHFWHTHIENYDAHNLFTLDIGVNYIFSEVYEISIYLFNPFIQHYSAERYAPTIMAIGFKYELNDQIDLMLEAEKNIYNPMMIKVGIKYVPVDRFILRIGFLGLKDTPTISAGFHYNTKAKLEIGMGINYHPVLGISSSVGFDYYLR